MAKYKVELKSCGNPDKGQDPFAPLWGAGTHIVPVETIEEAQEVVRDYIEMNGLGGGNWAGGKVWTEDDQYLGYISYNGRFWEGETK